MNNIKAIAICICAVLLIQPVLALGYDAQKEEDHLLTAQREAGWFGAIYHMTFAIYEAVKEQNQLTAEQTKALWVSACYVPHTTKSIRWSILTGNISALEKECAAAGYPTIIS